MLRISVAAILAFHMPTHWMAKPSLWLTLICGGIGILLALGLFTPFISIGGAAVGAVAVLLSKGGDPVLGTFVVVVMAALGMLGAGAYSLDARMYGRREVIVPSRRDDL
jgi:hypothetical protein